MGSLNERNPSLWVGTSDRPEHASLDGDRTTDVVVLGAGITGLTTARLLAGAGVSVVVLEAGRVCSGVTGYTTAKVTSLHTLIYDRLARSFGPARARAYAEANQAGVAKVLELAAADGIDCDLERASAFTYTEDEAQVGAVEAEVAAAQAAGLPATYTTDTDLPYPVRAAVRLDDQAQFHPRKYCLGLAQATTAAGGVVLERTRALDVDGKTGTVTTDRGTVRAGHVVIATHLPFPKDGAYFARAEPKRSYAVASRVGDDRPRGMYIGVGGPTRSIRSTPDGWLIVGGEGHKVGQDEHTSQRYAALESWARERFGVDAFDYRWSAQDYVSADGLPFVGRMTSGSERVFVATGYGKWGMTNGTAAAMILSDLVLGRDNPWAEAFDSTRLALKQGVKDLVTANLDVAKRFVGDRLTGDGPTCTHMGCRLTRNEAEETWDCPCHGSRFDREGHVVQGPAVKDLDLGAG